LLQNFHYSFSFKFKKPNFKKYSCKIFNILFFKIKFAKKRYKFSKICFVAKFSFIIFFKLSFFLNQYLKNCIVAKFCYELITTTVHNCDVFIFVG